MALTTEQIDVLYMRNGLGKFHQPVDSLQCEYDHCIHDFARAIEAEVRKDDEALILQLVEALEAGLKEVIATGESEGVLFGPDQHVDAKLQEAITAARARLAPPPSANSRRISNEQT